ncbi:Serine/threonine protein kinase [Lysobacter capsici AZ78]|uniref:Serine/threonine protein kinase n=1 Tax=Lysobacter capsici AZ78 TaxID=1444315 RepID=A0A120AH01_9GAMM|nr:protein kinase [Lysobacter capsici]KWS05375.1 Serine/threonine protein kinase [Lysobacter capsici AZ78]
MTPEQFARIEHAFHAALTRPPGERGQYLLDTEPDPEVRAAVRRLLDRVTAHDGEADADAPADPLSDRLAAAFAAQAAAGAPSTIGPYRLLRELGAGGMGTVFLAEREAGDGVQRVALKLLHGLPTQSAIRRMARERGLLASLDHPLIARHIDGGLTEAGQPYLVMDYVEGVPLHQHLADAPGSLRSRLQLFLGLCEAVQHAHQRLVLHRDLKPSNIVVRPDGRPALLDFGIATLIDGADPSQTATVAFTPGYGAPEQRRGEAATTATDVFGLGALLFDLTTGRKLSDLRGRDGPVPAPSRQTDDAALRRGLRGDLDRIVLTACAEDPGERYATVAALADDVRRYLDGLPISVATGGPLYRLRKFVARHRLATAAALLAVIAAGAFVWRLEVERQRALAAERVAQASRLRAEREAGYTEASRQFLASVLAQTSPDTLRGEPITVSALLARAAEQLQADSHQDDATRAVAWLTIAEVYDATHDPRPGLAAAERAAALLAKHPPIDPELHARLLSVRGSLLSALERHDEALKTLRELVVLRERQRADPLDRAQAHLDYIAVAVQAGRDDEVETYARRGLAQLAAAGGTRSEQYANLLLALVPPALRAGALDEADRRLQAAQRAGKTAWDPDHLSWYQLYRVTLSLRQEQVRYAESLAAGEQALRIAYRVYGERSRYTFEIENDIATTLNALGRSKEAIEHFERGRAIAVAIGLDPQTVAMLEINMGGVYGETLAQYDRAIEMETRALERLRDQHEPIALPWRARAHIVRAVAYSRLRRFDQAYADFDAAIALQRQAGDGDGAIGTQLRLVQTLVMNKLFDRAQANLDQARAEVNLATRPEDINFLPGIASLAAQVAMGRGDLKQAAVFADEALQRAAQSPAYKNPVMLSKIQLVAADVALRQGRRPDARKLLEQAIALMRLNLEADAPPLIEAEKKLREASS